MLEFTFEISEEGGELLGRIVGGNIKTAPVYGQDSARDLLRELAQNRIVPFEQAAKIKQQILESGLPLFDPMEYTDEEESEFMLVGSVMLVAPCPTALLLLDFLFGTGAFAPESGGDWCRN